MLLVAVSSPPLEAQATRRPHDPIEHPGWGASIESIIGTYSTAELRGSPARMCDLQDDFALRDSTLRGQVRARRAALKSVPVSIQPGDKDAESAYLADMFREVWNATDYARLIAHHQHGANFYGWAGSEIIWEYRPEERRFDPVDFYHPRSRTFRIATEYDPYAPGAPIDELLPRVGKYDYQVERPTPDKWIFSRGDEGVRLACSGLMYTSVFYSYFKTHGFGEWFLYIKRYGLPHIQITVHDWADMAARSAAAEVAENFGQTGALIMPKESMLNVEIKDGAAAGRASNSSIHGMLVAECNQEMAKLWSGGALTSEVGATGSYAQAREHGNVAFRLIQEDAIDRANSIQRDLIKPWVRFNNLRGAAPRVQFHLQRVSDPGQAVELTERLDKVGYQVDEQQLTELTGLRISRKPAETKSNEDK